MKSLKPDLDKQLKTIIPEHVGIEDFQNVFEAHYRSVFFFFSSRNLPVEDSRDLTQETFMKAYKNLDSFRGESKITTWLFQIATNIWRNSIRSDRTFKRDAATFSLDEMVEKGSFQSMRGESRQTAEKGRPLELILQKEGVHILYKALQDLPPQMRRCVLLRVTQDLKYREIALVMRLSIQTVKALLFQARQRLKDSLGSYFSDDYEALTKEDRDKESGEGEKEETWKKNPG